MTKLFKIINESITESLIDRLTLPFKFYSGVGNDYYEVIEFDECKTQIAKCLSRMLSQCDLTKPPIKRIQAIKGDKQDTNILVKYIEPELTLDELDLLFEYIKGQFEKIFYDEHEFVARVYSIEEGHNINLYMAFDYKFDGFEDVTSGSDK